MLQDCINDRPVTFNNFKHQIDIAFPSICGYWENFEDFLDKQDDIPFKLVNRNNFTNYCERDWDELDRDTDLEKLKYWFILANDYSEGENIWYITPLGQLGVLKEIIKISLDEQKKKLVRLVKIKDKPIDPFHIINGLTYIEVDALTDNYISVFKD